MKLNGILVGTVVTLVIFAKELDSKERHVHVEEKIEVELPWSRLPVGVYNIGYYSQQSKQETVQLATSMG